MEKKLTFTEWLKDIRINGTPSIQEEKLRKQKQTEEKKKREDEELMAAIFVSCSAAL